MTKKKRSRPSNKGAGNPDPSSSNKIEEEKKVIESLVEAFGTVSAEEAAAAYKEAKGDANKTTEILGNLCLVEESTAEDQSTTCSSASGIWASSSSSGSGSGTSFASSNSNYHI